MNSNTTGTVTAKIKDRPDYIANKFFKLYLNPKDNYLHAMSSHYLDSNYEGMISLRIPYNGDVTNETYKIDDDYNDTTTAKASYIVFSAGAQPYVAHSGELTLVNINMASQTATCSFKFSAKWGADEVEISEGLCDLKGFDDSIRARSESENKVSIPELSGAQHNRYDANLFDLSWKQKMEVGMPYDNWTGWSACHSSEIPAGIQSVLSVKIADHLTVGTYDLDTNKDKIHVLYMDVYPGAIAFSTISGSLTLESVPPKGSSGGILKGVINDYKGEAHTSDGIKNISFISGTFLIEGKTAHV
ncbi:hypothetical protein C5612_23455 [Pseudomonas frederiksbergensis]|uniref:Uncharacterized protein n=1 Tax=Pseudomonas frederiksbergensis TaxID=104087 RepID=A0A2S8HD34_9PSED|nr:hypothetical protein [Pseudomonas frederiksbergensis]PQP00440.1 hypothetical protein C5612_23455 [Pseudomonas frederiksbergensis]